MPIIHLQMSGQPDPALAKDIARAISDLTKDILHKKPALTTVLVSFVPDNLWFIDSTPLTELAVRSFHCTIKISDSTNLKDEKAAYIEAVHRSLSALLGGLHPVSYTAIHEMKADAYGYDGSTIEYTYINAKNK